MAKHYLTAKIKLNPTPEQIEKLWQTSDEARRLYNLALEQRRLYYLIRKKTLSHYDQKRELTEFRKEYFPTLHSQTAQEVILNLNEAYTSFFKHYKNDKTARPPRFRGFKYFYTLTYPQASYHLEDESIILHNANQHLKIAFAQGFKDIPRIKKIKQVEISCDKQNFYACITCEVVPKKTVTTGKEIAFDPGVKTLLTGFDGDNFLTISAKVFKKTTSYYDKNLDRMSSKLARSKVGSKRHKRLMKIKNKTLRKRSLRLKQANHCLAKELANLGYDNYYIGNLSKKSTLADTKNKKVDKKINRIVQNQLPLQKFIGYLEYKVALNGNKVEKVNEANSTKTCSNCGHKGKKLELSIRTFKCEKCGFELGRDENAAINLYKWYAAPVTGPPSFGCMSINFVFGKHNKCFVNKVNA